VERLFNLVRVLQSNAQVVMGFGIFVDDASGSFTMPRRPWRMNDEDPPPPRHCLEDMEIVAPLYD
jgi:hypothetical protein